MHTSKIRILVPPACLLQLYIRFTIYATPITARNPNLPQHLLLLPLRSSRATEAQGDALRRAVLYRAVKAGITCRTMIRRVKDERDEEIKAL